MSIRPHRRHCAGIVISGSLPGLPVSASVKKNMTAASARLVSPSLCSTQNQFPRYCTATNADSGRVGPLRIRPT